MITTLTWSMGPLLNALQNTIPHLPQECRQNMALVDSLAGRLLESMQRSPDAAKDTEATALAASIDQAGVTHPGCWPGRGAVVRQTRSLTKVSVQHT